MWNCCDDDAQAAGDRVFELLRDQRLDAARHVVEVVNKKDAIIVAREVDHLALRQSAKVHLGSSGIPKVARLGYRAP